MTHVVKPTTSVQQASMFPKTKAKEDPEKKMLAVEWGGRKKIQVVERPRPLITEPTDAIVRITTTTICGSDLHLYHHEFSGMEKGDVLGHEGVGIVEMVGLDVKNIFIGQRVVISAVIACGQCEFCKQQKYSLCDWTNPSHEMESIYGHRTAGLFGYSHLTGGFAGTQAQYVRVPLADMTLLPIPDSVPDEKAIFLSDVLCTGWHANELGEIGEGQTVAVWGCGPVGLAAIMCAKLRGARTIVAIDGIEARLGFAMRLGAQHVINCKAEKDVIQRVLEYLPGGPEVCIDAVGFRYASELLHKIERMVKLETDTAEILTQAIKCCRKGGIVSIVGDYYQNANHFPIGPVMEKGLTLRGSQVFLQKYWRQLLEYIEQGKLDPSILITHTLPLRDAEFAYRLFDKKEEGVLKILLKPEVPTTTSNR